MGKKGDERGLGCCFSSIKEAEQKLGGGGGEEEEEEEEGWRLTSEALDGGTKPL